MFIRRHLVGVSVFALTGCAVESSSEESGTPSDETGEELGEAQEAFTGAGPYGLVAISGAVSTNMVTLSGNAGFLMGFGGNIANFGSAHVGNSATHITLNAHAANGNTLAASGGWVTKPVIATQNWTAGEGAKVITSATATSRCFLTNIRPPAGGNGFAAFGDSVQIYQSGGSWFLTGTGNAAGSAACINVTTYLGGGASTTPGTVSLGPNQAGKMCWLTGVGGIYRTNSATDGVRVGYNSNNNRWELTIVGPNHGGQAECAI